MIREIWRQLVEVIGLDYCELGPMIWNVAFMLRGVSLHVDRRYKPGIFLLSYLVTIISYLCYIYVYIISMIWFVFYHCKKTGEVIAGMTVLSLGVSTEIGTTKLLFMFLYREQLKDVVEDFLVCDSLVIKTTRFSNNLHQTMRIVKKRALIFWVVVIGNGVAYVVLPVFLPARTYMTEDFILYGLDPMYKTPNYEIAIFTTTVAILFVVYIPANITAIFIFITGYLEGHLLALSEEIRVLWDDAQEYYKTKSEGKEETNEEKNKIINYYIQLRLQEIVKDHTTVLKLARQIENVFRWGIAIEVFVLLCSLVTELLGGLENTYIQLPYAVMQVTMDCLIGQRLMDASIVFENEVYSCRWENFDKSNMKTIQLILQSSQRTLTVSVGGIAQLSFACLMSICRFVYTAYTTLRTTIGTIS